MARRVATARTPGSALIWNYGTTWSGDSASPAGPPEASALRATDGSDRRVGDLAVVAAADQHREDALALCVGS